MKGFGIRVDLVKLSPEIVFAQTEQKVRHLVIDIFVLTFERLEMRKHLVSQRALKERGKMWKWRDFCERSLCKGTCGTKMYKTSPHKKMAQMYIDEGKPAENQCGRATGS